MFVFLVILVLNFGISWFNAWSVGRAWADSKAAGGLARLVVWCGAIMSACGFTYVYLVLLVLGASAFVDPEYLPPEYVQGAFELGYVIIIIPIIGSGIGITIHSICVAWRTRRLRDMGIAGWNIFAQSYNTYSAVRNLPGVFEHLGKLFKGGDGKGKALLFMVLLVVLAVCGGILTTTLIVRSTARSYAWNVERSLEGLPA
ncbi:hypothetical protein A2635_03580 [Candidatus Peribacteria bacterium RIFCSPHIGHO2_01_FULL_51_9]|nr:MAG: hypothetical protein A2635_03580 [Candidatus Peribacteria bacterium RIFCSPHIGHO2_01_FULL_51_9]